MKIEIVQLDKCRLFWSDPGYIRGPEIAIEDTCCAVSFTTHTFNLGDGGYSDDYVLYFPFHKKFGILYNRYYGKNYHGGSLKVVPDSTDRSFEALQSALVHKKIKSGIKSNKKYKRKEMKYQLLPFRFARFNEEEYLLSNDVGEYIFLKMTTFINSSRGT